MVDRSLLAALAIITIVGASGCCGMYPHGYAAGCGHAGCAAGTCGVAEPCSSCATSACDSCEVGGFVGDDCGCWAGGDACGPAVHVGSCAQGFLSFARTALHNTLTCGSGCGELYIDEWYSDPPDACDPCVDHARLRTAPCGCGSYPRMPWNLWGRRFQDGTCQSCAGTNMAPAF
jgi:hypothetical protein